ncbi:MAG: threonylcarbamoyl-AMP synthase [Myxococcales bacterium]|jgi:L-threonylcarbamoyladenylate synthase|nr:threonylcarbamoyl-AMP synthase [Myxococcales bacterium]
MSDTTEDVETSNVMIERAVRALLAGGAVIYPTETFYGLGAALESREGVRRIANIKHRTAPKPLPVIAADRDAAFALFREVTALARRLAERFWPGPLTIVLPASERVPIEVAPQGEIGVRVSSHPVARALAAGAGPLVATSANLAGAGEQTRVELLPAEVLTRVDAVVAAGETPGGSPSTVLRIVDERVEILREGAIPRADLEAVIGAGLIT